MTKETDKNHYSPVLANKRWTDESNGWKYKRYYFCKHRKKVVEATRDVGKRGWGFELNLYPQSVENRLDTELENEAEILYQKLLDHQVLSADERMKWGQFIVTQAIRTPTFFKYRDRIEKAIDGDYSYKETIIGCSGCHENKLIASRNWVILEAHEDDFFVRTDNPVYLTGFLDIASTAIFYPLSPKKCFVACSMPEVIPVFKGEEPPFPKQDQLKLEKGDTYAINFELIRSASKELILPIPNNNQIINTMILEVLGSYPQIPFLMSQASNALEALHEKEKLIEWMSEVDGVSYPYRKYPFESFYGVEFSMGINPFSVFGVTESELISE